MALVDGTDGAGSFCPGDIEFEEHDVHIEVNGVVIHKPFIKKPVDADDHNIAIYYPSSAGSGCKMLLCKVGDRLLEFYPEINDWLMSIWIWWRGWCSGWVLYF